MKSPKYIVILGDVIASSQQRGVQAALHRAVVESNSMQNNALKTPFMVTRGDEIAVIVDHQSEWFVLIRTFIGMILPLSMRWVIVYDEIWEGLEFASSAEASGPAFVRADRLMQSIKRKNCFCNIAIGNNEQDAILKGLIDLSLWRLYSLSQFQYRVLRMYQKTKNQQAVARQLGKSQQQIQKTLKTIAWNIIDRAEHAIDRLIEDMNRTLKSESQKGI